MTTKYILHGGIGKNQPYTQDFFDEMVSSLSQKDITLLYISGGEYQEKKEEKGNHKQQEVEKYLPEKHITVVTADEDPKKLLDQMHTADIIYLGGGDTQIILSALKQIPLDILSQHLQNKVIVAVSAGANALSKYYFSLHRHQVEEGLGVLPIKVFAHYSEEKEPSLLDLEDYNEQLTSFALPENEFVIIK